MKKLTIAVLLVMVVFSLYANTSAQYKQKKKIPEPVRVDKRFPTIYLTLEPSRKIVFKSSDESGEKVWVRLRNNSRWGIRLEASGEDRVFGNTRLFYDILSSPEKVEESFGCHVCTIIILGSGKSILFSFPKDHLSKAHALRFNFSYEWENDIDVFAGREPTHYVFLYANDEKGDD